jgi:hypothetical protein
MPFQIRFDDLPAGYSMNVARGGENVQVCMREFSSSEDGDIFISRLEGLSDFILTHLPTAVMPSMIDHLLAVILPDKTATIYINELSFVTTVRPRRVVQKGEPIFQRDILDIERFYIQNVKIPKNAGILILLSHGWRRGFYYDLEPLHSKEALERDYDLELLLGQFWTYLVFQDMFKIEQATWDKLFKQHWFPFIYLGYPLVKKIIGHARAGWDIDELIPEIQIETNNLISMTNNIWSLNPYFEPHNSLIEKAIERYQNEDHVSAASILYPRIEGVMRSYLAKACSSQTPSAANLSRELIQKDAEKRHSCCLFFPERFHHYLDNVYFAHFSPGSNPDVSRHSVAHGEARADAFNLKSSTIGLLILYQIALFLMPKADMKKEQEAT